MADKEVTVYIVDQGSSMGTKHNGREEDDLSFSLQYIWDKITTTIQADRKTFTLGIIGLRTDDTEHGVEVDDHSYDNISVQQEIKGAYSIADLREAQEKIKVSGTEDGDAISAVVVAYTMIDKFAPPRLKYKRKIVLVTNARGYIDGDDFDDIAERLNDAKIELLVLWVFSPNKMPCAELTSICLGAWILMMQSTDSKRRIKIHKRFVTKFHF